MYVNVFKRIYYTYSHQFAILNTIIPGVRFYVLPLGHPEVCIQLNHKQKSESWRDEDLICYTLD